MKHHRPGTHYPEIPDFEGANPKPAPVVVRVGGGLAFLWLLSCIVWLLHVIPDGAIAGWLA